MLELGMIQDIAWGSVDREVDISPLLLTRVFLSNLIWFRVLLENSINSLVSLDLYQLSPETHALRLVLLMSACTSIACANHLPAARAAHSHAACITDRMLAHPVPPFFLLVLFFLPLFLLSSLASCPSFFFSCFAPLFFLFIFLPSWCWLVMPTCHVSVHQYVPVQLATNIEFGAEI